MQFLSISQRKSGFTDAEYQTLWAEEAERARALYAAGTVRQIWHRADMPGACLLWETENEQQVRELLNGFPFGRTGMVETSIIPLKPYAGFHIL